MSKCHRSRIAGSVPSGAVLVSLAFVGGVPGQTFTPPILSSIAYTSVRDFRLTDLDRDGNPDLVLVNGYFPSGYFDYHLGDGDGRFGPRVSVPTAPACSYLTTGDVDLDGMVDVVVAGSVGARVHFGTATGLPAAGVSIPTLQRPVLTDVNRDGAPDLVGMQSGGSGCRILLGNGQGGFPSTLNLPLTPPTLPSQIHAADLDGDGWQEVVFLFEYSQENYAQVLGLENGVPTLRPSMQLGADSISLSSLTDWNGDGYLDLLITRDVLRYDGEVTVFYGGPQGFGPGQLVTVAAGHLVQLTATDLDADGVLDLLATAVGGELRTALGIGNGAVQPWVAHPGSQSFRPAVVDVTRDGVPDLVELFSSAIAVRARSGVTVPGAAPFGTGTPPCVGAVTVNLDSAPLPGNAAMRVRFANAPPHSTGLVYGGYPHVVPGYVHELGILLHTGQGLSITLGIEVVDGAGVLSVPMPVPPDPGLTGTVVSAQGAFQGNFTDGHLCGANHYGVVTSLGIVITVQ